MGTHEEHAGKEDHRQILLWLLKGSQGQRGTPVRSSDLVLVALPSLPPPGHGELVWRVLGRADFWGRL